MKKQRVFISSTYLDLIPHRKTVWELLQSFNVEISGMEKFGARTEKPIQTCILEVESSNIFIGIIGMRYGSIEIESGKSFSQLEYEKALDLKQEILIYLIDEFNSKITPNHIDFENYKKLKDFKNMISANHTIEKFISKDDLIKKISVDLRKILGEESVIPNYRPKKIKAEIYNIIINKEDWIIVLGIKFGKPHEIYIGKKEGIFDFIGNAKENWIIRNSNENGEDRFDFQYVDEEGYRTTLEGLSRLNSDLMVSLTSKLLEKDVSINKIIEIMEETDFNFGKNETQIKKNVIQILLKQINPD